MNQLNVNPWMVMEIKQQHEELIKKIALERLLKEAARNKNSKIHRKSKILALIGKELAGFGVNLEERYSIQSDIGTSIETPSNAGGCL